MQKSFQKKTTKFIQMLFSMYRSSYGNLILLDTYALEKTH